MSAAERAFAGLSDEQMRVRPREDLNSLAWLMWHIARAEDIMVNQVLSGRPQLFEDGWSKRLGITRRDFGIGMTSAEVTELTRQIDVGALREYRDAVGRRTREIVGGFKSQDWDGQVSAEGMQAAADAGGFGARTEGLLKAFTGRPRTAASEPRPVRRLARARRWPDSASRRRGGTARGARLLRGGARRNGPSRRRTDRAPVRRRGSTGPSLRRVTVRR
jgi:DinB superfamily